MHLQWFASDEYIHTLLPAVIQVRWIISEPIRVMEGDPRPLELVGEALGIYANPLKISVCCAEPLVTDVEAGMDILSNTSMLVSVNSTRLLSLLHQGALCNVYLEFPN